MSCSIIASRDVNELPPMVAVLGGCTSIKSVSDLRENRFKGKHVLGLAQIPNWFLRILFSSSLICIIGQRDK